jgi:hypothetical protein
MTSEQRPARRSASKASAAIGLDLAVAGVIVVLGVAVWIETGTWREARNLAQDPTVLPRGIALVLWAVAVSLVIRVARRWRGTPTGKTAAERVIGRAGAERSETSAGGTGEGDQPTAGSPGDGAAASSEDEPSLGFALLALAAVTAYAWIAFRLGWMVTTWLFLVSTVLVLGRERWSATRLGLVALVGVIATAALWFGFVELLNVRIPRTLLQ